MTPFAGNRVDEEAFRMLVEAQIAAGVAGIVAVGTTGESPTLTVKEHLRVIELAVESAAGRIQVIAGTGATSTAEAIHMTQEAEKMGVDGTLQVCPYYNKPSPGWRLCPFKAIADATCCRSCCTASRAVAVLKSRRRWTRKGLSLHYLRERPAAWTA
ncbi:MAG: dihydrodipicolinate synthase family protein [Akkermansia sp.]